MRASRVGADPDIVKFERNLCRALKEYGIPFFATEFCRDRPRQELLLATGKSKAAFGSSAHNFGMAVDVIHSRKGWDLHSLEWDMVGLLGKEVARKMNLKVTWGGDWKFYDPAHWQIEDWRARVQKNGLGEAP